MALHHLHPLVGVEQAAHVDAEPEPVEQLRPQLTLLGVHGPDQEKLGRVAGGYPLALHRVDPHRGGVQQDVDQVMVEQVHLVDVEDLAVGLGQQSGLEGTCPGRKRRLHVDAADHPVLGRPEGQVDNPGGLGHHWQHLARPAAGGTGVAEGALIRAATIGTAGHHRPRGQHRGQGPHQGRLGRAPLSSHQDPADPGLHRRQHEGQLHALLTDHGREGESRVLALPPDCDWHHSDAQGGAPGVDMLQPTRGQLSCGLCTSVV